MTTCICSYVAQMFEKQEKKKREGESVIEL